MRTLRPFVLILMCPFLFLGCGTSGDEKSISEGLEKSLTSTDPTACTSGYTKAFLDQGTFGNAAVAGEYMRFCRSNIKQLAADEVDVSEVRVDGDRAEVDFSASGGAYAVKKATLALTKQDNEWRLNRLEAIALQRPQFERQQARLTTLATDGLSRTEAACYERRLRRVDDGALERAIVDADPSLLGDYLLVCVYRPELRKAGLSTTQTSCVLRRVQGSSLERFARLALTGTKTAEDAIKGRFRRATTACLKR